MLENESRESVDQQVKLGMDGVLPNLGGKIKCGNSLVGPDFYDAEHPRKGGCVLVSADRCGVVRYMNFSRPFFSYKRFNHYI